MKKTTLCHHLLADEPMFDATWRNFADDTEEVVSTTDESRQPLCKFNLITILGEGGFGLVFLADNVADSTKVALKQVPIKEGDRDRVERELNIHRQLDHTSIVRCHNGWILKEGDQSILT